MIFICQLHSSVQLVTFALGWVQLISGQYCFAHRYDIVELELPDEIACLFFPHVWKDPHKKQLYFHVNVFLFHLNLCFVFFFV